MANKFHIWGVEVKTAIYARVSDMKLKEDGQRRQDINRQIDMLKEHCIRKGYTDFQIYADDGKSGWTDDLNMRQQFAQMRRDAFRHFIGRVVIESLDRFSSNLVAGMDLLREFGDAGCVVESLQTGEHEVTSDDGWMKSAMFMMLSEYRIRNLRSKIKSGMGRITKKCESCGIVHMGRHPLACNCKKCLAKKGGVKIDSSLPPKSNNESRTRVG